MIDNKTAALLGDYLIINGICANSASLSTGKAGIALTLFELSHTLGDQKIGHYASNILSEALLIQSTNHRILHGTSGVGYALLYLIEEGFIEASFDELFADHHEAIITYAQQDLEANNAINLTPADLFYFAKHASQSDQSLEIFDLLVGKTIENLEVYTKDSVSNESTPTLHSYCHQLMALLDKTPSADMFAQKVNSIVEKLKQHDDHRDQSPARTFLKKIRQELLNNTALEEALSRNNSEKFSNTSKAMLVLLEWLSEQSKSTGIQSLKTILNA